MLQELMNSVEETPSEEIQPSTTETLVEDTPVSKDTGEAPASPTADPPPKEEPKKDESVPLPVYLDLKHELRDLRQEMAAMRQPASPVDLVQEPAAPAPRPLSPVEMYVEEYVKQAAETGDPVKPQDVPLSYGILQEQKKWEQQQEQVQSQNQAKALREQAMNQARVKYSDAVLGQGLGFETVVSLGNAYLTPGDRLDIAQAGAGCAELAYERCFDRLVASGTPQGQTLQQLAQERQAAIAAKHNPAPAPQTPQNTQNTQTKQTLPDVTETPNETPPEMNDVLKRPAIFDMVGIEYPGT